MWLTLLLLSLCLSWMAESQIKHRVAQITPLLTWGTVPARRPRFLRTPCKPDSSLDCLPKVCRVNVAPSGTWAPPPQTSYLSKHSAFGMQMTFQGGLPSSSSRASCCFKSSKPQNWQNSASEMSHMAIAWGCMQLLCGGVAHSQDLRTPLYV